MKKQESLIERIDELRAELEAHLNALAEQDALRYAGVPQGVLRNLYTRGSGCVCNVVRRTEQKRLETIERAEEALYE